MSIVLFPRDILGFIFQRCSPCDQYIWPFVCKRFRTTFNNGKFRQLLKVKNHMDFGETAVVWHSWAQLYWWVLTYMPFKIDCVRLAMSCDDAKDELFVLFAKTIDVPKLERLFATEIMENMISKSRIRSIIEFNRQDGSLIDRAQNAHRMVLVLLENYDKELMRIVLERIFSNGKGGTLLGWALGQDKMILAEALVSEGGIDVKTVPQQDIAGFLEHSRVETLDWLYQKGLRIQWNVCKDETAKSTEDIILSSKEPRRLLQWVHSRYPTAVNVHQLLSKMPDYIASDDSDSD